ncbi:MAG: hypothetical protein R3C40_06095 [Parvularculaceae bacterium]
MKKTATIAMSAAILLAGGPAAAQDQSGSARPGSAQANESSYQKAPYQAGRTQRPQYHWADFVLLTAPARKPLTTLTFYGHSIDLNASGRYALSRRWDSADDFEHAEDMGKAIPGYPQPPIVMVDAKLRF